MMEVETYELPFSGLLAAYIVCDFLYRMTLPKEVRRLMVVKSYQLNERLFRVLFLGEDPDG